MLRKPFTVLSLILVSGMLLSGCIPAAAPTVDPIALQATVDEAVASAMKTEAFIMTSTAAALPTSTFTVTATLDPTATKTAMATPTAKVVIPAATKTKAVVLATKTPSATAAPPDYVCSLVSTSPAANTKMGINADFDAVWTVKNIGGKNWDAGMMDLKYVSGTKMQTGADVYDINTAVAKDAEIALTVDMKAPSAAGIYTATFVLTTGSTTLCTLPVTIEATP